jgi:hypothetical protein
MGRSSDPARRLEQSAVNAVDTQRMRILLQQKETGLYFKDIDSWIRDSSQAMDFVSSTAAIDFCVTNKLAGVQLVLKFEEHRYDIVLPVVTAQAHGDELLRDSRPGRREA